MKYLPLILLMLTSGCSKMFPGILSDHTPSNVKGAPKQIMIMGQSNGVAFSPDGMRAINEAFPGSTSLNCAVGGSTIDSWAVGGANYGGCVNSGFTPSVIFWYQGENDTEAGTSHDTWAQKFTVIARDLHSHYPATKIVFAQLATTCVAGLDYWQEVKDQQASVYLPYATMVKTDDLPLRGDCIHLQPNSEYELGKRVAREIR